MEEKTTEVMVGVIYYFKHEISASASYQRTDRVSSERIQILKSLPAGEGFGGRASFERNQSESETLNNYNIQLQYNASI